MTQYLEIHPANPQRRLIRRAVEILRDGGVIVYPAAVPMHSVVRWGTRIPSSG